MSADASGARARDALAAARARHEDTVAFRRDLHRHPEIAFEEVRTAAAVAARLREAGLEVREGVGGTGVMARLRGSRPGPTVLLRADMDALPVQEVEGRAYGSTIDDRMHACGHDGHTAILTTVAGLLAEHGDLPGTVLFAFQPAEEIVEGASAMLADGALDGERVDHVLGLHLGSTADTGTVLLAEGPIMAATDTFDIAVHGRGGHAAMPEQTVDPIIAAAQLVTSLQALVARETAPGDSAVVSVTAITAGNVYNVIPDRAELKGTLRTFDPDLRARLHERIVAVASGVAAAHGAEAEVAWHEGTPAVVNDAEAVERMRSVAAGIVGEEGVRTMRPMMGGDDMALWLQRASGCYAWVGARNEAEGITAAHHHPAFDIDEASLPIGVALLYSGALAFLDGTDGQDG